MPNIISVPNGKSALAVVGGLEWIPLDALDSALTDVKEAVSRRKEKISGDDDDDGSKLPPLGAGYAVCNTRSGTCSAGILPILKGMKLPKGAVSLAVLCARYAQKRKMQDAIFGWRSGEEVNLVAIKNGLPIYDAVLNISGVKSELSALLSMYENGCSAFGDEDIFQPPVAPLDIAALSDFATDGKIMPIGASQLVQVLVFVTVVSMIGGYFYWDWQETQRAEEAAAAAAAAAQAQPQQQSPLELFEQSQLAALAGVTGCASVDAPASALFTLNLDVKGYQATTLLADCMTGQVTAGYQSGVPADLSVRQADSRLRLNETLTNASLSTSFKVEPIKLDSASMKSWQDWLVEFGALKQKLMRVGLNVEFGPISPVFNSPVPIPEGARVVSRGKLVLSGPAQYMVDVSRRFSSVSWDKVAIQNQGGFLMFNLTGEYYAIND